MKVVSFFHHSGSPAYALQDPGTGLYFVWCYSDQQHAIRMSKKGLTPGWDVDRAVNWRERIEDCVISHHKHNGG